MGFPRKQPTTPASRVASHRFKTPTLFVVWGMLWALSAINAGMPPGPILEHAPVQNALRQSAVDTLFQDREGFLWIGTREGLVRWDGSNARYWHPQPFDSNALRQRIVVQIDQDASGDLWVATRSFIHGRSQVSRLVAPQLEQFVHYPLNAAELALDAARQPWLTHATGIYRYRRDDDRFELWIHRDRPTGEEASTAFGADDTLWIVSPHGLERCQLALQECKVLESELPPIDFFRLFTDGSRMLLPTRDHILCVSDSRPFLTPCVDIDKLKLQGRATTVERDTAGNLWLATLEEVWQFSDPPRRVPIHSQSGSAGDDIYALLGDHAGGMWAGTPWGLLYWDPQRQPFELLAIGADSTGPSSAAPIISLHEDRSGKLWVGTIGDGLYARRPEGDWRHFPEQRWAPKPAQEATFIWSISSTEEAVWLATTFGVVSINRESETVALLTLPESQSQPKSGSGVRKILPRAAGGLWVMAYSGTLYQLEDGRFDAIYTEPEMWVEDVAIQRDGKIWLGTATNGLRLVDPATGEAEVFQHVPSDRQSLADCSIFSLWVDSRDDLWIGTGCGLARLPADRDRFQHVLNPSALPSSAVLTIFEGPQRFWMSTNRGLVSLDKDMARRGEGAPMLRKGAVTVWGQESGVGNLEFNRGAVTQDQAGHLLFGGDRGITRFLPEEISQSTYQPPIRLESLTLMSRHGSRQLTQPFGTRIEIAPDVTSFTVELGTVDFSSPPRNRFALQLTGVDPDWIELGTRRAATYAGVQPGRYRLEGRVSNRDDVWNEHQLDLELIVIPPFYRTLWFQTTAGVTTVLALFTIGALVSRQRYQRQLERLQIQQQRDEDRRRISRDLHDELGAGLTQIVLSSEKEMRRPSPDLDALQRIADGARRLIDAIREIIWSIDPQHDRLDRLLSRLRAAVAETLEVAELQAKLEFPQQPPELPVSPQVRRNLSLIVREAVHNIVRHARASQVRVTCEHDDTEIRLLIADNGRGFDPDLVSEGHGLRNLRNRAQASGGDLTIDSQPGTGTQIRVRLPLAS